MRASTPALTVALIALSGATAVASPSEGGQFRSDAALIYRVAACAGDAIVKPGWRAVVDEHCGRLGPMITRFRDRYALRAGRFLGALAPARLPATVLYPFGGGDLVTALITFPAAAEITTMSLEHAGDPRALAGLDARALRRALADLRSAARGLLVNHDSASERMIALERSPLPGQLTLFLLGAAALGLEPVGLRYFRLADDGTIDYLDASEIATLAATPSQRKHHAWVDPGDSTVFDNAELTLRRPDGSLLVHRHLAANLDDAHLRGSPLERHLRGKGEVAAMTKAASYCLWNPSFAGIRDLLVAQAVYMVSDSTGVPARFARAAGLEQITYGRFTGPYLATSARHGAAMVALWTAQPARRLGFRYGYPDAEGNFHLMVTRRPAASTAPRTGPGR